MDWDGGRWPVGRVLIRISVGGLSRKIFTIDQKHRINCCSALVRLSVICPNRARKTTAPIEVFHLSWRMCRRSILAVAVAFVLRGFAATTANAQATIDLHVRLDAGNGTPGNGALVALLDGDRVITEALSSENGTVTIRSTPGSYRVRVRRIGFHPFVSDPVALPFKGELRLHIETKRIVLDAMVVSASAQCGAIKRDAQTLSTVWDEITKALRASQLTPTDLNGIRRMQLYKRELGKNGEVTSSDSSMRPVTGQRPFGVPDPTSLVRLGYVRGDPQNGWEYFGPDEAVLLSSEFAATHCFKVVRDEKKREGQIGVAFEPAPKRTLSDIKGVLWVDEKSAELRDVGFVYVNAGVLTRFEPGGFTKFRRVASGSWIVSEWQLTMPILEVKLGFRDRIAKIGSIENGGFLVSGDSLDPKGVNSRDSTRKK